MIFHSRRFRASSLATLFALSFAPPGVAGPPKVHHVAGQHTGNAMHQQAMSMQHQHAAMMRNQNGLGNNNSNQANGPVVSALHSTMIQLTQADHDYNGHRARAIHEIHTAIRHLNPQAAQASQMSLGSNRANRTGNGNGSNGNGSNGNGNGNGNGQRMPQATSDAHLREAHQSLMAIHSQMINNGGNAQHHTQARASVQRAIQELNVALNVN